MLKRKFETILNDQKSDTERVNRTNHKIYSCIFDDCKFEAPNAIEMFNHKRTHYYPLMFFCGINRCECAFDSQSLLTIHLKQHKNKNNKFECNYKNCTLTTIVTKQMQIHTITHSINTTFVCGIINCRETFVSQKMLKQHRDTHKIDGKYVCDFEGCQYKVANSHDFQIHQITHLETRPFKCENCIATFCTQTQLDKHGLTHSGARKFICNVENCTATFKDAWNLDRHHLLIHSDFEGFDCLVQYCGRKFQTKSNLERHFNSQHAEEKTMFECDECDQAYPCKAYLVRHVQDHHSDEEKRFKCDHCSFKTNYLHHLNYHIETHERQKSYTFVCNMQDGGTQAWSKGDIPCTVRCKTQLDLEYHIERNHTLTGIASKFESERKLAEFLTRKNINFTRDHENTIRFTTCKNIDPRKKSARPDFYLVCKSAELGVYFILENDEFAHRRNPCDFERLYNILIALREKEKDIVPIVFLRFNPHHFKRNGVYYSMSLTDAHEKLYKVIQSITREQLIHDVNLIYVNYDKTNDKLEVFNETKIGDYAEFFEKYVIMDV